MPYVTFSAAMSHMARYIGLYVNMPFVYSSIGYTTTGMLLHGGLYTFSVYLVF